MLLVSGEGKKSQSPTPWDPRILVLRNDVVPAWGLGRVESTGARTPPLRNKGLGTPIGFPENRPWKGVQQPGGSTVGRYPLTTSHDFFTPMDVIHGMLVYIYSWIYVYPYHPWDGYIYLHEWLVFMVNVGKYTIHGLFGFMVYKSEAKYTIPMDLIWNNLPTIVPLDYLLGCL